MTVTKKISILGSGGHGKIVVDALLTSFPDTDLTIYDGKEEKEGSIFMETFSIISENDLRQDEFLHVAIGDNEKRMALIERHRPSFENLVTIQHKNAVVSTRCSIGRGCFFAAGSIISASAEIGHGVIINHLAVVDHDCFIDNGVHIAPNATLGGRVKIGPKALVGAGAVILRGLTIGEKAIIGAGAVVTKDVPPGEMVIGIPAKKRLLNAN